MVLPGELGDMLVICIFDIQFVYLIINNCSIVRISANGESIDMSDYAKVRLKRLFYKSVVMGVRDRLPMHRLAREVSEQQVLDFFKQQV